MYVVIISVRCFVFALFHSRDGQTDGSIGVTIGRSNKFSAYCNRPKKKIVAWISRLSGSYSEGYLTRCTYLYGSFGTAVAMTAIGHV